MTIGIISLAFLATVAAYGAPIALAAEAAAIGGAGAAAGVKCFISINLNVINDNWHLQAAASTSALTTTKGLVISQKGNLAKLSSYLIGKSAQKVSDEYGGMSAIQSEVISIIKSPTIDKNFKLKAMETLKDLKKAYKQDKKNKDKGDVESEIDDTESLNSILNENGLISKNVSRIHGLYVKDRMELEVFTLDGKLQIRDVKNDKILH